MQLTIKALAINKREPSSARFVEGLTDKQLEDLNEVHIILGNNVYPVDVSKLSGPDRRKEIVRQVGRRDLSLKMSGMFGGGMLGMPDSANPLGITTRLGAAIDTGKADIALAYGVVAATRWGEPCVLNVGPVSGHFPSGGVDMRTRHGDMRNGFGLDPAADIGKQMEQIIETRGNGIDAAVNAYKNTDEYKRESEALDWNKALTDEQRKIIQGASSSPRAEQGDFGRLVRLMACGTRTAALDDENTQLIYHYALDKDSGKMGVPVHAKEPVFVHGNDRGAMYFSRALNTLKALGMKVPGYEKVGVLTAEQLMDVGFPRDEALALEEKTNKAFVLQTTPTAPSAPSI